MLLHGGSAHAHWWDHIAVELAQTYRVIALDLRGHGDSGWASPSSYEIEDYVADLTVVVTALHLPPFILVGHSLGGLVSLTYATRHAAALRALIVVDMGPRTRSSRRLQLLSRLDSPVFQDEEELFRRFRLLPEETSAPPELLRHVARQSVKPKADGKLTLKLDRAIFRRQPHDVSAQLTAITCPVLLIRGEKSLTLTPPAVEEMKTLSPSLQVVEIPNAGHHVFLDDPVAFLRAVRHFLQEEKSPGRGSLRSTRSTLT
jgi:pimeloyl-ACP methyl ester carboxylesterase